MIRSKPILNSQHILEKEFRIDTRGYRMTEVDVFLDAVIADYNLYEDKLDRLVRELNEERSKNLLLEKEIEKLKTRVDITSEAVDHTSNPDLLKRLSELEKMVYKNK